VKNDIQQSSKSIDR